MKPQSLFPTIVGALFVALSSTSLAAESVSSELSDQKSVGITIYNDDLSLVKDIRQIDLGQGISNIAYRGVSANLRPETALLRNLNNPGSSQILEQNFDFDLLSPDKMLNKFVGKTIRIARFNSVTGEETIEEGTLLSNVSGTVVRIGNRIETNPTGRFIFDEIPDNLIDKPTLSIQLNQSEGGTQDVELSYLTSGLGWKADYVAELNADESELDLVGWVTLTNQSGTSYQNATLQLVAGDVNQVAPDVRNLRRQKTGTVMAAAAPESSAMEQESLFEYHLYTLGRPTNIANQQTKQVSLLSAQGAKVTKELVLQGSNFYYRSSYGRIGQKMKLGVYVEFENTRENNLGNPLPKGVVRVYKRDSKGRAQFVGEDRIDHTPRKDKVRLKLGNSFDVTANKNQTDFDIINKRTFESSYRIELKNPKDEVVRVVVREPVPGDWKMRRESHPHKKAAAGTAEWIFELQPDSTEILTYRVRTEF